MLTLGQRVGNAVRLAEVVQILVRHGFADLVRRAGLHEGIPAKLLRGMRLLDEPGGAPETLGQRMRAALTELGPTFIKFGQILSTRPDLIGNALSEDLRHLQDRVAAAPFEEMEVIILAELESDVATLFSEFEREPIASASLSQVYRARTLEGESVAVKIQRPGIAKTIESDLSLMTRIAEWTASHLEEAEWIDPVGIVDEFTRSIRRELDFHIEARVIEKFGQSFEGVSEVFTPRVHWDLSNFRVLTMDWVDGVRVDALDEYDARNCIPKDVAVTGCRMVCKQVFEHQLFHADPHPGNIFITHNNQIAFIDYGMVGHLERTDAAAMADLLYAMFREDASACVEALLMLTTSPEPADRKSLEHDIAEFIAFEGQVIVGGGNVGKGIERTIEILRRNHLQLASRFSLLLKSLVTIESVGHLLDPKMDMVPIIQPYVEHLVARRYSPMRLMGDAREGIAAMIKLSRELPVEIQQFINMLRLGRFKAQINHEGLERLASVTDRASNRIAFGVITGSLIIGSSLLMRSSSGLNQLGLMGYIVAGVLGLSLVISIIRSKNY